VGENDRGAVGRQGRRTKDGVRLVYSARPDLSGGIIWAYVSDERG
jgi:hypothetical protein